jgi:hypothetical protein
MGKYHVRLWLTRSCVSSASRAVGNRLRSDMDDASGSWRHPKKKAGIEPAFFDSSATQHHSL